MTVPASSASEAVAWRHPTAGWVSTDRETIAMHCRKDEEPQPLYPSSEIERLRAEVERLKDFGATSTETGERILQYLGIGHEASREPGADRRRDKLAAWIERAAEARAVSAEAERVEEWNARRNAESERDVEKAVSDTLRAERDAAIKVAEMNATSGSFWAERGKNAEAERDALKATLSALYEWYDRDGSVGGASTVFEEHRAREARAKEAEHG